MLNEARMSRGIDNESIGELMMMRLNRRIARHLELDLLCLHIAYQKARADPMANGLFLPLQSKVW